MNNIASHIYTTNLAHLNSLQWALRIQRFQQRLNCLSQRLELNLILLPIFLGLYKDLVLQVLYSPPAPMNHVKFLRAGPAEMPFQTWYTANTNHFRLTDFCQAEISNTTGLSNRPSTA